MTLQQCHYLIEIEKQASITKAAQSLFVTQPSISKAVHELEKDLNIQILTRTSRGVFFTAEGKELLSYAKMLVEQEENIRYHFSRKKHIPTVKLIVSSQHFSFAAKAASEMAYFFKDRPFEFSLLEGKASDVIQQTADGISSAGILSVSALNRELLERSFSEHNLAFFVLASVKVHVFLNRNHPLASCSLIRPEQLSPYLCLTYRKDDTPLHFAEGHLQVPESSRTLFIQDRGTMDNLLVNTTGYNLGTGCICPDFIHPDILAVPLDVPWQIHIGYIHKKDMLFSEEMQQFLSFLKRSLNESLPMA